MTEKELDLMRNDYLQRHIPVMRPKTARLLAEEVERTQPKQILEIGTCVGLGVIETLLHCDGFVTTVEIDEDRLEEAKKNVSAFGLTDRCRFILDDCKKVLPAIGNNRYDFVVLDGPKSYYRDAYPIVLSLIGSGGKIFMDDVLFYGLVDGEEKPEHKHRTNVMALRELWQTIQTDGRVRYTRYDMEDGVVIVEKL